MKESLEAHFPGGRGKKKESQGPFPVWSLRAGWVVTAQLQGGRDMRSTLSEASVPQSRGPKLRFSGFEATLRIVSGERRGGGCISTFLRNGGAPQPSLRAYFPASFGQVLGGRRHQEWRYLSARVQIQMLQVSAKPTPAKIQTVALLPDIIWFIKIVERYGAQVQTFQAPTPGRVPCIRAAGAGQVIRYIPE